MVQMIGEFYKHEHLHRKTISAASVSFTGSSEYILKNAPSKQRKCTCKECGIVVTREVPRVEFKASYHYQAGHYCPQCGLKRIANQKRHLERMKEQIEKQIIVSGEMKKGLEAIIEDEWYPKKMALGKMFGVMQEKAGGHREY